MCMCVCVFIFSYKLVLHNTSFQSSENIRNAKGLRQQCCEQCRMGRTTPCVSRDFLMCHCCFKVSYVL